MLLVRFSTPGKIARNIWVLGQAGSENLASKLKSGRTERDIPEVSTDLCQIRTKIKTPSHGAEHNLPAPIPS